MVDGNMSEIERRDLANAHRGEVVPGSGTPVAGRRLGQVVSVRLEPDTIAALRGIANRRGMTVSDLLREGAGLVLATDRQAGTVRVSFHVNVSPPRSTIWRDIKYSVNPIDLNQVPAATA
jgi:Ribbon-helix-helix protein, copG family